MSNGRKQNGEEGEAEGTKSVDIAVLTKWTSTSRTSCKFLAAGLTDYMSTLTLHDGWKCIVKTHWTFKVACQI